MRAPGPIVLLLASLTCTAPPGLGCAPPGVPVAPVEPVPGAAPPDAGARPAVDAGGARDGAASGSADRASTEATRPAGGRDGPGEVGAVEVEPGARPDGAMGSGDATSASAGADADASRAGRTPEPGDLAIDELLIDPAGTDLGREWIELVSLADEPLDLTALHLADSATDVAVDAGVLAPRGVLVLGQSADTTKNGGVSVDRAYGTRLQLNNDADRIALCAGPCAGGVVLDLYAWTAAPGAAYQGHAVVIDPFSRAICPATAAFGAEGSFGSPGAVNPSCAPASDGGAGGDPDGDRGPAGDAGPDGAADAD